MGKSSNLANLLSGTGKIDSEDIEIGATVSNGYVSSTFSSNTYLQAQGYGTGNVANNYLQAQGYGTGDVSNNYSTSAYVSNTSFEALKSNSLGRRNIIINGAMQVAQRSTSVTGITSSGYYTVDRHITSLNNLGTFTQTVENDGPDGFSKSLKLECTTADASPAAGDYMLIGQHLEGQNLQHLKKGTSSAESVTASFWVKSNKTGTYIFELVDPDNSFRHIGKSFTVNSSGTWEYKTITFEGDTTGAFDNDNALSLQAHIWLGAGSTYNGGSALQTSWDVLTNVNRAVGNVNLADTIGNYIQLTGVQLEVGETATPFEHRSYGEELALCQRYYEIVGMTMTTSGQFDNAVSYAVTKRAVPTLSVFSGSLGTATVLAMPNNDVGQIRQQTNASSATDVAIQAVAEL